MRLTEQQEEYLVDLAAENLTSRAIANKLNKKFGLHIIGPRVTEYRKKHKLYNSRLLTEEQQSFVRAHCKGSNYKAITALLNAEFQLNLKVQQVANFMKRKKITTGCPYRWKKGQPSHNKGQKVTKATYDKMTKTMFAKGNAPWNKVPIGTERRTTEGYLRVKVGEPNQWVFKHRLVWEQHNGPVPKGYNIMFADQDKSNCNIENLLLISKAEQKILQNMKLVHSGTECVKTGLLIAKLACKIKEKRK